MNPYLTVGVVFSLAAIILSIGVIESGLPCVTPALLAWIAVILIHIAERIEELLDGTEQPIPPSATPKPPRLR